METSLLARLLGAARTVAPLAPVNAAALTLPQLGLGQTVRAQVTARLTDGSFRVVVNNAPLKLLLPAGTKAGDVVTLRVVAREPQLELALDHPVESVQPRLSGAGRLIGQILREPVQAQPQQSQPVTPAPVLDAAELAQPLARAIQVSGLFYESHQARWIDGDYPLALLQEEPQNAAAGPRRAIDPHSPGSTMPTDSSLALPAGIGLADALDALAEASTEHAADDPAHSHGRSAPGGEGEVLAHEKSSPAAPAAAARPRGDALPDEHSADATAADAMRAPGDAARPAADGDDLPQARIARELLPVVRQQLDAIETRQIVWQGELWPGQPIRWQIADPESDPQQPQAGREWLTRFVLRLPALGEVGADLAVGARGVRIVVTARDSAAAEALRTAAPELAQALEAAGLRVGTLEVRHHAR